MTRAERYGSSFPRTYDTSSARYIKYNRLMANLVFTVAKNCQPVLCALLFKVENVCLVVADVMKKLVPRRANFVLSPAAPIVFRLTFNRVATCCAVITG